MARRVRIRPRPRPPGRTDTAGTWPDPFWPGESSFSRATSPGASSASSPKRDRPAALCQRGVQGRKFGVSRGVGRRRKGTGRQGSPLQVCAAVAASRGCLSRGALQLPALSPPGGLELPAPSQAGDQSWGGTSLASCRRGLSLSAGTLRNREGEVWISLPLGFVKSSGGSCGGCSLPLSS